MNDTTRRCKVFMHQLDGHVFVEKVNNVVRWVARLQCSRCGTWRTDTMIPQTCELVSRKYDYTAATGYDHTADRSDAKRELVKSLLQKTIEQSRGN